MGNLSVVIIILLRNGFRYHIDVLVQERRNSIANTLELRLSCTNPSILSDVYHVAAVNQSMQPRGDDRSWTRNVLCKLRYGISMDIKHNVAYHVRANLTYLYSFSHSSDETGIFRKSKVNTIFTDALGLASPGQQQPRCWLLYICKIKGGSLPSTREDFNYHRVLKNYRKPYFYVSLTYCA